MILREALSDQDERALLVVDLERAGISTHDNIVDLVLNTVRAGAAAATYMLQSATRPSSSPAAIRMGYGMDLLWGELEPRITNSRSEAQPWIDHSILSLAAFNPWTFDPDSSDLGGRARVTQVGLFDGVHEIAGSAALRVRRLQDAGRELALRSGYDSARHARRARAPWDAIEVLNSTETAAGDFALAQMAGSAIGGIELARFAEATRSLDAATTWRDNQPLPTPSDSAQRSPGIVPSMQTRPQMDVLERFETARPVRDQDTGGQMIVWYGTDRQPIDSDPARGFENRPAEPGQVHYGRCVVTVPQAHHFGEIRTSLRDRIVRRSGDGRLRLQGIVPASSAEDFATSINTALGLAEDSERAATVFIHGYNTSFEQAAIRAAQLGFDLHVDGITAMFSWPSAARWHGYPRDADNVELSEPALSEFIATLTGQADLKRVNFIVHSMGNRLVARTLKSMEPQLQEAGVQLGAIVLAAPDINARLFKQLADAYARLSPSTTMYVSERDKALALSYRSVWRNPRAGFTPPITVVPGIDTIEVTDVDVSRLGHGYYAAAEPVLYDIRQLLQGAGDPTRRPRLRARSDAAGDYWQLAP